MTTSFHFGDDMRVPKTYSELFDYQYIGQFQQNLAQNTLR